jgi:hypothetical protein
MEQFGKRSLLALLQFHVVTPLSELSRHFVISHTNISAHLVHNMELLVGAASYLALTRLASHLWSPTQDPINVAIQEISNSLFVQSPRYFNGQQPTSSQVVPLDELSHMAHSRSVNLRSTALQLLLDQASEERVMETCLKMLGKDAEKATIVLGLLVTSDASVSQFLHLNGHNLLIDLLSNSFPHVSNKNHKPPTKPQSPITETMCFAILYNCATYQMRPLIRAGIIPICRDVLIQAVRDDLDKSTPPRVPIDLGYWTLMMLSELGSVWDPSLTKRLAEAGFPKLLLQTSRLTFGNPQTVPATALRTLAQMLEQLRDSPKQAQIVKQLVQQDDISFVGVLVQGLRSDDARMVYYSLLLTCNLCDHAVESRCEPSQALASNLVRLLAYVETEDFAGTSDRLLFESIRKFCKQDSWAKLFIKAGIMKRCCQMLKSSHSNVRLHTLQVLAPLFDKHPDTHKTFYDCDGAKLLIDSARENLNRVGHLRHLSEFLFVWVTDALMTLSSHAKDADPLIDAGAVSYSLALLTPMELSTHESRYAGAAIILNLSSSGSSSTSHRVYQEFERCGVTTTLQQLLLSPNFGEKPRALLTRTMAVLISRKKACLQFAQRAMPVALEVCQELTREILQHREAIDTLVSALQTSYTSYSHLLTQQWMDEAIQLTWRLATLAILLDREEWSHLDLGSTVIDADTHIPTIFTHEEAVQSLGSVILKILTMPTPLYVDSDYKPPKRQELIDLDELNHSSAEDLGTWRLMLTTHGSILGQALIKRGCIPNQAWLEPILDTLEPQHDSNCLLPAKLAVVDVLLKMKPRPDVFLRLARLNHSECTTLITTSINSALSKDAKLGWMHMSHHTSGLLVAPDGATLRNDAWTFESARANVGCTREGRYGYHVQIATCSNVVQVGWSTKQCEFDETGGLGVGDDEESYAIDGLRRQKWHGLSDGLASSQQYGEVWSEGGVLTCLMDLDRGEVSYEYNGIHLGVAFTGVDVSKTWFPSISMSTGQECTMIFGDGPSGKLQLPDGYSHLRTSSSQMVSFGGDGTERVWRMRLVCVPDATEPGLIGLVDKKVVNALAVLPPENLYHAEWTEQVAPGDGLVSEEEWEIMGRLASLGEEDVINGDGLVARRLNSYSGDWICIELGNCIDSTQPAFLRASGATVDIPSGEWMPFWRGFSSVVVELIWPS